MMGDDKFSLRDFAIYFGLCWIVSVAVIGQKLVRRLGRDPVAPLDPHALAIWRARRSWLIAAEITTTVTLALAAVLLAKVSGWDVWIAMMASYAAASVGLPFLVHAMMALIGQRLGVEIRPVEGNDHDHDHG